MIYSEHVNILNANTIFNIGARVRWGSNITFGPNCHKVTIGYGAFIGDNLYIDVEELSVGDYFTIHHGSVLHGKQCIIGHNVWIGHYCILDSSGGLLKLGNNVGVGAHSQLWSHMKFGDRLAGCRWFNAKHLVVGDDAWFVGHCLVAPVHVEARAMLMLGGVAVKDMKENHIYSGSPAQDVTGKMGHQFREMSYEEKEALFKSYLCEYEAMGRDISFVEITEDLTRTPPSDKTFFAVLIQKYIPRYTDQEYDFMRFLLYDRAKFLPLHP